MINDGGGFYPLMSHTEIAEIAKEVLRTEFESVGFYVSPYTDPPCVDMLMAQFLRWERGCERPPWREPVMYHWKGEIIAVDGRSWLPHLIEDTRVKLLVSLRELAEMVCSYYFEGFPNNRDDESVDSGCEAKVEELLESGGMV